MSTLLDHSAGFAVEAAFNDNVTAPSVYGEVLPDSDWGDWDPKIVQGEGLRVGAKFALGNRRVPVIGVGSGGYKHDLLTKGFGKLLKACFGKGTSTVVSGALYQQLFEATQTNSVIDSLIWQERIVKTDGTVDTLNWTGVTVDSFTIGCQAGEFAKLQVNLDAAAFNVTRIVTDGATTNTSPTLTSATAAFTQQDVNKQVTATGITAGTTILSVQSATSVTMSANATATGTGLTLTVGTATVTPSYVSGGTVLSYAAGSGTIGGTMTPPTTTALGSISGGSSATIAGFELSVDNGLDKELWKIGSRAQPTVGRRVGKLKLDMFYDSTTGASLAAGFRNQTAYPILLELDTNEVVGSGLAAFQIAATACYISSGAIPQPKDDKTIRTSIEFDVTDDGSSTTDLFVVMRTADTAL